MNKRNVLTDGFTAEDFELVSWDYIENGISENGSLSDEALKVVTEQANALLAAAKRDAMRVWSERHMESQSTWATRKFVTDTHTGLLIGVRPISPGTAQSGEDT